jgi:hypothetical protein
MKTIYHLILLVGLCFFCLLQDVVDAVSGREEDDADI